jgi:hypothetical protein
VVSLQQKRLDELFAFDSLTGKSGPHEFRRITVITSCTNRKAITHPDALGVNDFLRGERWVAAREASLPLCPAETIYTGQQHQRLMAGVAAARQTGICVAVKVVSAGYGLISGDRRIVPYNVTFSGLSRQAIRASGKALALPEDFASALFSPSDIVLVLLGRDYLAACDLTSSVLDDIAVPTVFLTGSQEVIPDHSNPRVRIARTYSSDTRTFKAGMVSLKGAIAQQFLAGPCS